MFSHKVRRLLRLSKVLGYNGKALDKCLGRFSSCNHDLFSSNKYMKVI